MFEKLKRFFTDPARFYMNIKGTVKGIVEALVLVVIVIVMDINVVPALINGSTSVGAIVLPIVQAAMLVAAILGAIAILYVATDIFGGK